MRGIEQIPWLYDAGMAVIDALALSRWRRELAAGAKGRVLEVGCGTGRTLPGYPRDTEVVGLDPDRAALHRARRRAPRAAILTGRAEALPFPDASFDTVVTSLSFCTVPDVPQGLAEIHRVLRHDGELRMLEHVRSCQPVWGRFQDRIQPAWTAISGGCHLNRCTEEAVERAGFCIDPDSRCTRGVMRLFSARKQALTSQRQGAYPRPEANDRPYQKELG